MEYSYIVFMDVDGVVADINHRLHFQREKDYDKFYSPEQLAKDTICLNGGVLATLLSSGELDTQFVFVTGRPERTRDATEDWLSEHFYGIDLLGELPHFPLLMRKDGDYRPSNVIKVEAMQKYLSDNNILDTNGVFIDDDLKNVIAVENAFPNISGILYSTERLGKGE